MASESSTPLLLKQLSLPTMMAQYEEQSLRAQKQHWSYVKYLSVLSSLEVASREQKRIARHLKEAKLPINKRLDTFDFSANTSINPAQIEALAEEAVWVQQAKNVLLFGPSGVGKSHLACAITARLIEQGVRALYTSTTELVQRLQQARSQYKLPELLTKLSRIPLLVLDDIGYVKKSEQETSVLFELIAKRYESHSLLITSNQPFSEWDQIFPDHTMAVAAIDRLVHHATIITLEGESYRKQQLLARAAHHANP